MPLPPYAHPEVRELVELLDLDGTTNDDKVHWLRPQTRLLGLVPTSTLKISKVIEIIHRFWMGSWIHHHATSTIYAHPEVWELVELLDLGGSTNDDKVH